MKQLYLDYAASTPIDSRVLSAMRPYYQLQFYNPSATYLAARKVRLALQAARVDIARIIGVKPGEIIFTSGATEANNIAIAGIATSHPNMHIVSTVVEHSAILEPIRHSKLTHTLLPVTEDGLIQITELRRAITDKTVLVSIGYGNNETGVLQDMRAISAVIESVRASRLKRGVTLPLYYHTDASQAAGFLDCTAHRLKVDMMSFGGSKLYGPKQSGCLYVSSHIALAPLMHGGGQEQGVRPGTENAAGIIGFATAFMIAASRRERDNANIAKLRLYLEKKLGSFKGVSIVAESSHRLPHICAIRLPITDGERLVMELDEAGIQVGTGAACSARSDSPSHVLLAYGMSASQSNATIRVSLGRRSTKSDIDRLVRCLNKLLKKQ